MARRRVFILLLVLSAPLLLEANARFQADCPVRSRSNPCATDLPQTGPDGVAQRQAALDRLWERRRAGTETIAEAEATARSLVVWVDEEGWPYNGVACRAAVFTKVRGDLPFLAERYVLLHELEHLMHPHHSETQINYIAARRAPVGMALTVVVSVARRLLGEGSLGCKLAGLWRTFQTYFLDMV